jgi:hypothetical protein
MKPSVKTVGGILYAINATTHCELEDLQNRPIFLRFGHCARPLIDLLAHADAPIYFRLRSFLHPTFFKNASEDRRRLCILGCGRAETRALL